MTKAYQITNWDENYEVAQSRKYRCLWWCARPNALDGKGYEAIAEHEHCVALNCAWDLIIRVAAQMPKRGLLVADSGRPLTAKNLAFKTHYPVEIFELALIELCKPEINWIERIEIG